jgi:ABC-type nitrate/sulfonate/bicarbonate transport system substrate-binding protein
MMQAMAAGNIVVGDTGLANTIVAIVRDLPLQALYLGACSTPRHPFERFMVMENSPIRTLDDLKDKKLAFLGPGSVPDMLLGALSRKTKIRKEDVQLVPMPGRTCLMRWRKVWWTRSLQCRRTIRSPSRDTRPGRLPTRLNSYRIRD